MEGREGEEGRREGGTESRSEGEGERRVGIGREGVREREGGREREGERERGRGRERESDKEERVVTERESKRCMIIHPIFHYGKKHTFFYYRNIDLNIRILIPLQTVIGLYICSNM